MKTIILLSLFLASHLSAADRYFINGGVDNNWGTAGNWSTTDGGAGGAGVPTSSDAVYFTSNSPNCTVNASARVAASLDFTGYSGTITMSQQITVSLNGYVTLSATMTIAGSGSLIAAPTTLTSNGKTWPNALTLQGAVSTTFTDDWTVGGLLSLVSTSSALTLNGGTINAQAGLRFAGTSGNSSGSTVIKLAATGTLDAPSLSTNAGRILNPITIDAGGGVITVSERFLLDVNRLKYVSGTVITTVGTWASCTGGSGQRACPIFIGR